MTEGLKDFILVLGAVAALLGAVAALLGAVAALLYIGSVIKTKMARKPERERRLEENVDTVINNYKSPLVDRAFRITKGLN